MRTWMLAALSLASALAVIPSGSPIASQAGQERASDANALFRDPDLPDDRRLADLISRLTREEKIAALSTNPAVPRLGIAGARHVEGLHGLAYGGPSNWGSRDPMPTTTFPQAVGLGQTWDTAAVMDMASIEGHEARFIFQSPRWSRGGLIVRAPNADLARDIRWGRTEESFGEDPFLAGTLTSAFVKGLQGNHPRYWQAASLMKHLLANSNENDRESSSSDFDARLMREYYSVPFRMGVEAGANAYMAAYNRVNGVPCTVHPFLRAVTMAEWGLDGIICTDGGALGLLVTAHKYYPGLDEAAAASIKAGITVFLDRYVEAIREALRKGLITERDIDQAILRNFRVSLRLGLLDPAARVPYAGVGATGDDPWTSDRHKAAVRRVTRESIVLLKNSQGLLPLDASRVNSVAVIGPRANEVLLDWYSGTPPYRISPLQGIRQRAGRRVKVGFAADNTGGAAVSLARNADVAIVVVGNHPTCGKAPWAECPVASDGREAVDRRSIDLEQEALVKEVHAANPRTVVVLRASFPYAINWSNEHVPAIITMAHNSQEEGAALADVLFGDYNPAGRLVHTWPRSLDQLPPMMDYDIRNGRTHMYFKGMPLYPFGHGLSYTTFGYSNLRASAPAMTADGSVEVSVDVKNTGTRGGDEVVQLYVSYPNSRVPRPIRELEGFARVPIAPGETRTVRIPLHARQLAWWDESRQAFVVEPGEVRITVGGSSVDERGQVILAVR